MSINFKKSLTAGISLAAIVLTAACSTSTKETAHKCAGKNSCDANKGIVVEKNSCNSVAPAKHSCATKPAAHKCGAK